jgi:hypothetical protein
MEIDGPELNPALGAIGLLANVGNVAGDEQAHGDQVERGRDLDEPAIRHEREGEIGRKARDDVGDLGGRRAMELIVAISCAGDGEDAGDA